MKGGKRREEWPRLEARVASGLLDEALQVFGALQASAWLGEGRLDGRFLELLRFTALDVLDDVACLGPLVASLPDWAVWPREPARPVGDDGDVWRAVELLAEYTQRLVAVALIFDERKSPGSTAFARVAAAAEARLLLLGSS